MSVLREHLTAVAALRRALADAKAAEVERQAALQETEAYRAYATAQEARRDVERAVGDAERALRAWYWPRSAVRRHRAPWAYPCACTRHKEGDPEYATGAW